MHIKMTWAAFVLILATVASGVEAGGKKDEDRVQGTWLMKSGLRGGEKAPEDIINEFRLTFAKEGKVKVKLEGRDLDGTYKLSPDKTPKEVDFVIDGEDRKGIYVFEGDNLKMCVCGKDEARPAAFASEAGTQTVLVVLKREKK
jgi:uncharacterized protein (TIGR03067 family)